MGEARRSERKDRGGGWEGERMDAAKGRNGHPCCTVRLDKQKSEAGWDRDSEVEWRRDDEVGRRRDSEVEWRRSSGAG